MEFPSSQASPSLTWPSPQWLPVKLSVAVQSALQKVQVALP
jgi:hypothetical protein